LLVHGGEEIAAGVAGGQDAGLARQLAIGKAQAKKASLAKGQALHAGVEQKTTSGLLQHAFQTFKHLRPSVRAHVRMGIDADGVVAARAMDLQLFEHEAHRGMIEPGEELAVRIGSGTAQAEVEIGLGIQLSFVLQDLNGFVSVREGGPAFNNQGTQAGLSQAPGGEKTSWSAAQHDHLGGLRKCWRCRQVCAGRCGDCSFREVFYGTVDSHPQVQDKTWVAAACIEVSAQDFSLENSTRRQTEVPGRQLGGFQPDLVQFNPQVAKQQQLVFFIQAHGLHHKCLSVLTPVSGYHVGVILWYY